MAGETLTLDDVRKLRPVQQPVQPPGEGELSIADVRAMLGPVEPVAPVPPGKHTAPSLVLDNLGTGKALAVSAGRGVDKLLAGAKQLFYKATGNEEGEKALAEEQRLNDLGYKPFQNTAPVTTAIGEAIPGMAMTLPITGGSSLLPLLIRGGLAGGLPGLLAYGETGERLQRGGAGAAGGLLGAGAGYGLAKVLQPAQAVSQVSDDAIDAAKRIGYQPTAAQRTQNPALGAWENYLSRTPGYATRMGKHAANNQAAVNRAATRAIGEQADEVSEAVLGSANNRIGNEFKRLNAIASPDPSSPTFVNALNKVDASNLARGPYARADIAKEVEKGLELSYKGKVPGTAYQEIRSELGSAAQAAFTSGDASKGNALKAIQAGLDAAAKDSLSKADQQALDLVRKQYAAFKVLTKGQVTEAGNVSPARLATALRQQSPTGFKTGTINSDLMDIARVGQAFKPVANPNSSMPSVVQSLMQHPLTAVPLAMGNRALGSIYMNPVSQAYLSAQWLSPQMQQAMIASGAPAGLLGVNALRNVAQE